MAQVNVTVNGRMYTVACGDGEEQHLIDLAKYVDKRVTELGRSVGQVGDARLLLMAALLVADELSEALQRIDELEADTMTLKQARTSVVEKAQGAESTVAEVLEVAARRIEDIAARLDGA